MDSIASHVAAATSPIIFPNSLLPSSTSTPVSTLVVLPCDISLVGKKEPNSVDPSTIAKVDYLISLATINLGPEDVEQPVVSAMRTTSHHLSQVHGLQVELGELKGRLTEVINNCDSLCKRINSEGPESLRSTVTPFVLAPPESVSSKQEA
ncbi:hypothetical protein F2Q69_00055070 [Brassica cretica]|uniref:Uncharacterized protein n=1 Tax=Brassica cretica TaxID=69181 RepID=A0A8S9MS78_BRACR|nr:hypothetical protein F2Q69_00055070 [Brassica cretica]